MIYRIALICEWLDSHVCHTRPWRYLLPFRNRICEAAEVSYGWGPRAVDWHKASWTARWLHRRLF